MMGDVKQDVWMEVLQMGTGATTGRQRSGGEPPEELKPEWPDLL
jgi:hypothetical protein